MSDLDEIPIFEFKWPCSVCGSNMADSWSFDRDTRQVIECSNCELVKRGEHAESKYCWCEPVLDYSEPDSGTELWVHNDKQ